MYEVQVHVPGEPYDASEEAEWQTHTTIAQLESDHAELMKAWDVRQALLGFYLQVRIVKWRPGGGTAQIVT